MTPAQAMAFVEHCGVVLVSARGPVPRLTEAIVNEPIEGSWWGHPKSHHIFAILEALADSEDILVCRLVRGKITLVHRRLWPALVRSASRFPSKNVSKVRQEHTDAGHHVNHEIPFPGWVPAEVIEQAKGLGEEEALALLGPWAIAPDATLKGPRRLRRLP
jgi:hypothetical protein